jgi:hypothetical protein
MTSSEKKTRRRQYSPEQKLLAIAPMLSHNRQHESAAQGRGPSHPLIAKQIAAEYKVAIKSVWNWYGLYRRGGYAALARRRRADFGRFAYFLKWPNLECVVRASLAAGSTAFSLAKTLRALFGSDAPSYEVLLRYARHQHISASSAQGATGSAATR